jgi:hypothetical protein
MSFSLLRRRPLFVYASFLLFTLVVIHFQFIHIPHNAPRLKGSFDQPLEFQLQTEARSAEVQDICERQRAKGPSRTLERHKFTVIISTWRGARVPLPILIGLYTEVPSVDLIVIVWHDPITPPSIQSDMFSKVPVYVHQAEDNSLNNRFLPLAVIRTQGVLSVDDDILASAVDIEASFRLWNWTPSRLASPFVRSHRKYANSEYKYMQPESDSRLPKYSKYSMAITKFLFMPSHLLFKYSCLLPRQILSIIDHLMNCEDIAMNLLAASVLDKAPLALDVPVDDWGNAYSGLSSVSVFSNERSACLNKLIDAFGGENLTYNIGHIATFQESKFAERTNAYVDGSFYPPIISKEAALSIIGKSHTWRAFTSSSLFSTSLDECHFCGQQITGVLVYEGQDGRMQGGPPRILGIRFAIRQAHARMGQRETVLHGCSINDGRSICTKAQYSWSAPTGENIVSIDVHQITEDFSITGLVLHSSGGSSSPLLGTTSPFAVVASSSFRGGICAARTGWMADAQGQATLRNIGFIAREGGLAAQCFHLSGDATHSKRSQIGHHFLANECKRCGRHITGVAVYQRLKRPVAATENFTLRHAALAGLRFTFGQYGGYRDIPVNTDAILGTRKSVHLNATDVANFEKFQSDEGFKPSQPLQKDPRIFGCGLRTECFLIGNWSITSNTTIAQVEVFSKQNKIMGIALRDSSGAESPVYGGVHGSASKRTLKFKNGICGAHVVAGASIEALALIPRQASGYYSLRRGGLEQTSQVGCAYEVRGVSPFKRIYGGYA